MDENAAGIQQLVVDWIDNSERILIKKLSRNDCQWADGLGHQNGVYIPVDLGSSDLFPPLFNQNEAKSHILETRLTTFWPQNGELKNSRLVHYSNKGSEMHFTGVPKDLFAKLSPASLLLGGIMQKPVSGAHHWFILVDSASPGAELLESMFDLKVDFQCGIFRPSDALAVPHDETDRLISEIDASIREGRLLEFIQSVSTLPSPDALATSAQEEFLRENARESLNPFAMIAPGDAIMRISRDIEFKLYKQAELRHRAAEVVRIVTSGNKPLVEAVVRGFPELDATFLSASQHRKSRAGLSFEKHIGRLLTDGNIRFEPQVVMGGRRPDFVLPNVLFLNDKSRDADKSIVLSAKTTLRERWKQLNLERFTSGLFLATVDDRISTDAIREMASLNLVLVVPESLKDSKQTDYDNESNVITFKDFFEEEIKSKRGHLLIQ